MSQAVEPAWLEKSSCVFYKLMVASILRDKKLKIPSKFARKYREKLASIVTLTSQNGGVWIVELEKVNQNIWFHKGWHEFVEYYSIRAGYFLVFGYEGKSNFNVHIFSLPDCEINSPSNALSNSQEISLNHNAKESDGDNVKKVICSCPACPASDLYWKEPLACKYEANEEYMHGNGVYNIKPEFQSEGDIGSQYGMSDLHTSPFEAGNEDSYELFDVPLELMGPEDDTTASSRKGRLVTPEQKQRTLKVASMFRPESPSCTIILRPSYVHKGLLLHLPRWFARLYLNGITGFITLQCKEKQWLVKCVCMNGNAKLSSGWPEFVWENNLDDGDVCVFEVIDTKSIVLKVTLFRVIEVAESVNCLQP